MLRTGRLREITLDRGRRRVAGYAMFGGVGVLGRALGFMAHQILAADVSTTDGSGATPRLIRTCRGARAAVAAVSPWSPVWTCGWLGLPDAAIGEFLRHAGQRPDSPLIFAAIRHLGGAYAHRSRSRRLASLATRRPDRRTDAARPASPTPAQTQAD